MKERALKDEPSEDPCVPLIGRREEVKALSSALCGRQSCLVAGPAGIGKTRLVQEALRVSRPPAICLERPQVVHGLLVDLAEALSCRAAASPISGTPPAPLSNRLC